MGGPAGPGLDSLLPLCYSLIGCSTGAGVTALPVSPVWNVRCCTHKRRFLGFGNPVSTVIPVLPLRRRFFDGSILFGSNRYGIFRCVFPHDSRPLCKENVSRPKSSPFCRPGRGKGEPGDPHGRLALRSLSFVGDDSVFHSRLSNPTLPIFMPTQQKPPVWAVFVMCTNA